MDENSFHDNFNLVVFPTCFL